MPKRRAGRPEAPKPALVAARKHGVDLVDGPVELDVEMPELEQLDVGKFEQEPGVVGFAVDDQ